MGTSLLNSLGFTVFSRQIIKSLFDDLEKVEKRNRKELFQAIEFVKGKITEIEEDIKSITLARNVRILTKEEECLIELYEEMTIIAYFIDRESTFAENTVKEDFSKTTSDIQKLA